MAVSQRSKWCRRCEGYTLHVRNTFSGGWGCLLTILTAGLFLPIWLLIGIFEMLFARYHCQQCGKAR